MSDNFLSRWSKRKLEVREQEKLADTTPVKPESTMPAALANETLAIEQPELPLPTEADLLAVEQGGDIKAFMVDKVSKELKNKAFKALFSRPEFNVMDGLDIYIDDYNKFTPLSQEDIGKMTLSKQLLSRPDLDLPKVEDIQAGIKELVDKVPDPVEADEVVLDKEEAEELDTSNFANNPDDVRVIPDESQAIDSEELLAERSFEKHEKKSR